MASKKGVSSTRNGRDSNAQYLGVKRFGGQVVKNGEILVQTLDVAKMTHSSQRLPAQSNSVALAVAA